MSRSDRIERRLAAKRSYQTVPFLRRSRTLESILATTCVLTLIVLKIASQVGLLAGSDLVGKAMALICLLALLVAAFSALVLCTLTLTGPVYKKQLDFATGELETYGPIDKFATIVLAALIIGTLGYIACRFLDVFV